jgi:histidinol-phosphate aminotransferase
MSLKRSLEELVPSYVAGIRPYVPGKPIEEVERELGLTAIKLASNENPLGPSPMAVEAAAKNLPQSHRYPDAGGYYLREKLAARHDVSMEHLVLGAGSTELIQLLSHIYISPGVKGLGSEGSFVMFPLSVRVAGGEPVLVPLTDYTFDLEAIASHIDNSTRIVYLANPNNPTGTMFTADVVLDEAYCDYVARTDYGDSLEHVRAGRYLIVLRTFSKIHGLAGLRVGYGVGHPEIISALNWPLWLLSRIPNMYNARLSPTAAGCSSLQKNWSVWG